MKIFKAGLIGCGFFSQHHLEAWRRMANVQIVAACDYQMEKAQTAALRAYASAEEMLEVEELDFVDVVTRSPAHLELISQATEKELPVICQKPIAPDWETACRIVEVVAKHRIQVMIHDKLALATMVSSGGCDHCPRRYWHADWLLLPLPAEGRCGARALSKTNLFSSASASDHR